MENKKLNEEQTKCLRKYLEEDNVDGVKKCFEDSGLVPVFGPMSGAKDAHEMSKYLEKLNGDCYALVYGFENDFWEGWGSSGIDYYFSNAMVLFDWDGNIIDITTGSRPTSEIKDRGDYIESCDLRLNLPERAQNSEHLQKKEKKRIKKTLGKEESVLNFKYPDDALQIMKEYMENNEKEIERKQKNLLLSTPERQEKARKIWDIRKQYRSNEMR